METSRRFRGIALAFVLLLVLLAGRLFYIQVTCQRELSKGADSQQMIPVIQKKTEAKIYDRNMRPMTSTRQSYYYLLHRDKITSESQRLLALIEAQPAGEKAEGYQVYKTEVFVPFVNDLLRNDWAAYGFCLETAEEDYQVAAPLLSDLKEMFAKTKGDKTPVYYLQGDGIGNPLMGAGILTEEYRQRQEPAALMTTIDLTLQVRLEEMLNAMNSRGCIVAADTKTGQILAMASWEDESTAQECRNLVAEECYPAGLFYHIIETVASEERSSLIETAQALGLGQRVFDHYPGEVEGRIDMQSRGKHTMATPVQVCQMLTIIANGGRPVSLSLLMSRAPSDSISCFQMTEAGGEALKKAKKSLALKPLSDDGWMAGYVGRDGRYAVVAHVEEGKGARLHQTIEEAFSAY